MWAPTWSSTHKHLRAWCGHSRGLMRDWKELLLRLFESLFGHTNQTFCSSACSLSQVRGHHRKKVGHNRGWRQNRDVALRTVDGGLTYHWLKPTGQYGMKQIPDEVRCSRTQNEFDKWSDILEVKRCKSENIIIRQNMRVGAAGWGGISDGDPITDTHSTSPHQSCPHSRCHSHTASGLVHSGCFYSGTGTAHMSAQLRE